jgi:hypothetical protein
MTRDQLDKLNAGYQERLISYAPVTSFSRWWMELVRNFLVLSAIRYVDLKAQTSWVSAIYQITLYMFVWFIILYGIVLVEAAWPRTRPQRGHFFSYVFIFFVFTYAFAMGLSYLVTNMVTAVSAIR